MESKKMVTIETIVHATQEKVWEYWTNPGHITKWNNASEDWYTPHAENDLREGGSFLSRMEARDGSSGFDFSGIYHKIIENARIDYTISDGRSVKTVFLREGNNTKIIESFETENVHSKELQQAGWQSILDNFKKYTESN